MSEVYEAAQILLVTGQFSYVIGKLTVATALQIAKVLNTVYLSKWQGKTSLNRFRNIKGDDFIYINVRSEDRNALAAIEKEITSHGILLARLPDLCGGDRNTQYVISPSDVQKFKIFLLDHNSGRHKNIRVGMISASDYADTARLPDGQNTPEFEQLQSTIKRPYELTETQGAKRIGSWDVEQKLHDAAIRKDTVKWIYQDPVKKHKNWNMYKMPDGRRLVLIPKQDMQGYRKGRDGAMYPPRAAIFPGQQYLTLSLKDGEQTLVPGNVIAEELGKEDIEEKNYKLKALQKEIYSRRQARKPKAGKDTGIQKNPTLAEPGETKRKPRNTTKVTINKVLFHEMVNNEEYITRIPYHKNSYVAIPKTDAYIDPSGVTLVAHLQHDKKYRIMGELGNEWVTGEELKGYYDEKQRKKQENGKKEMPDHEQLSFTISNGERIAEPPYAQKPIWTMEKKEDVGMAKTIVEKTAYTQKDEKYLVHIPDSDSYIQLPKSEVFILDNGKLVLFLKESSIYDITDSEGNRIRYVSGDKLIAAHNGRERLNTVGNKMTHVHAERSKRR